MQKLGNATFTQAVLNVINIVTGVGLLSVPFALRRAGWAGVGILWLMGFINNYTGKQPSLPGSIHHPFPLSQM
jgi:vesicular inhibitory amino acid transporter